MAGQPHQSPTHSPPAESETTAEEGLRCGRCARVFSNKGCRISHERRCRSQAVGGCAKCGRPFALRHAAARASHERVCDGSQWSPPVRREAPTFHTRNKGSRARAQLLDSQGFAVQWLCANRAVDAASRAIAHDPSGTSKLTRASTRAAASSSAGEGGSSAGGAPQRDESRETAGDGSTAACPHDASRGNSSVATHQTNVTLTPAERYASTVFQPVNMWLAAFRSKDNLCASTSPGSAPPRLPAWALVRSRQGYALNPSFKQEQSNDSPPSSRVGVEFQAEIPPYAPQPASVGAIPCLCGFLQETDLQCHNARASSTIEDLAQLVPASTIEAALAKQTATKLTMAAYCDQSASKGRGIHAIWNHAGGSNITSRSSMEDGREDGWAAHCGESAFSSSSSTTPASAPARLRCCVCGRVDFYNRGAMISHERKCERLRKLGKRSASPPRRIPNLRCTVCRQQYGNAGALVMHQRACGPQLASGGKRRMTPEESASSGRVTPLRDGCLHDDRFEGIDTSLAARWGSGGPHAFDRKHQQCAWIPHVADVLPPGSERRKLATAAIRESSVGASCSIPRRAQTGESAILSPETSAAPSSCVSEVTSPSDSARPDSARAVDEEERLRKRPRIDPRSCAFGVTRVDSPPVHSLFRENNESIDEGGKWP